MRFVKRVAGNGHVTVPSDLRSVLAIESGDIVEFEVVGIVRPRPHVASASAASSTPSTS